MYRNERSVMNIDDKTVTFVPVSSRQIRISWNRLTTQCMQSKQRTSARSVRYAARNILQQITFHKLIKILGISCTYVAGI
jgi:hypothetical protein